MEQGTWFAEKPDYSKVTLPTPRGWQIRGVESLRQGFKNGHRRQILCAATGAGKTIASLQLLLGSLLKGKRAIFVCDRDALINQTSARADQYDFAHGIIQADHWRRDNSIPFQICSIHTIAARDYWPEADLIVIDECHVKYKAATKKILSTEAAVVGLSATPCTDGLSEIYTNLINAATMHELTQEGILVPLRIKACVRPNMEGAKTSASEWTASEASQRESEILGDVVNEWIANGEGRKTVAFGADIAYCNELVRRFNEAGIQAISYTSETPTEERIQIIKEFEKPDSKIKILSSVAALSRGFDVPDIGCLIDARPLRKSLSEVIQMYGRGLRCSAGKTDCLLLDHSGNSIRFLPDLEEVYYNGFQTLKDAETADKRVRKEPEDYTPTGCPQCGGKPFSRKCLSCGYERKTKTKVDESAGVMVEIMLGGKKAATNKLDLWRQIAGYVIHTKSDRKQSYACALFKNMTGEWPANDWHVDFTDFESPTKATQNEIRRQQIAYSKRKQQR